MTITTIQLCEFETTVGDPPVDDVVTSAAEWVVENSGSVVVNAPTKFGNGAFNLHNTGAGGATYAYVKNTEVDFETTAWTLDAWHYIPASAATILATSQIGVGLNEANVTLADNWALQIHAKDPSKFTLASRAIGAIKDISMPVPLDRYFHVALTYDPNVAVTMWVSGKAIYTLTSGIGDLDTPAHSVVLRHTDSTQLERYFDRVRLRIGLAYTEDFDPDSDGTSEVDSAEFDFEVATVAVQYVINFTQFSDAGNTEACRSKVVPACIRRRSAKHVCRRTSVAIDARCHPVMQASRRIVVDTAVLNC